MAEKWGFPHELVQKAEGYLGEGERKVSQLLQSLEQTQHEMEGKLRKAEEAKREAESFRKHTETLLAQARKEEERLSGHRLAAPVPWYCGSTMMARREAFDAVGGFDPGLLHTDVDDWVQRCGRAGLAFEVLPDVLTRRRLHRGNLSRTRAGEKREAVLALVKATLDRRRRGGGPDDPPPAP